jgi:hypothetical protein
MTIVLAAGRRIDSPNTRPPRFPLAAAERVRQLIQTKMIELQATGLVASGACGGDLLAHDVARQLRLARRRMVLPFDPALFRTMSVTDRPGRDIFGILFDELCRELAALDGVVVLQETPGNDTAYSAVNLEILDHAARLAGIDSAPCALLIWEGSRRRAGDLTADLGDKARARGWLVHEVVTTTIT